MKQGVKPVLKAAKKAANKKPVKKISALDWYVIHAVKKIRMERGITQADLSFRLNYADSFISQMESDKTKSHYNIAHLNALAQILKCSIHDFFPKFPLPEDA